MGFLGGSDGMVKNLTAVWETWIRSLGQEDPLEKGMATHSGILAWRIPWTEEPGGLKSMRLQKLRQERIHLQCRKPRFDSWVEKTPWRREWKPTPVFLLGEFHGQKSLAGCNIWGFPGDSGGKSSCNAGDVGLIPGLERFPREGNGNPF